jgi:hypothetical protein
VDSWEGGFTKSVGPLRRTESWNLLQQYLPRAEFGSVETESFLKYSFRAIEHVFQHQAIANISVAV